MEDLIKFRIENFASYGLNKYRNFLRQPVCEECGSSNCSRLLLKDTQELFGAMAGLLLDHGCPGGAIFAVAYDNHMYAAIANFGEDSEDEHPDFTRDDLYEMMDNGEIDEMNEDEIDEVLEAKEISREHDDDPVIFLGIDNVDVEFFQDIDANFRLCCYGMLIETKPGEWKIVED